MIEAKDLMRLDKLTEGKSPKMGHGQIEGHPLGGSFIYGKSHWEIDVFWEPLWKSL